MLFTTILMIIGILKHGCRQKLCLFFHPHLHIEIQVKCLKENKQEWRSEVLFLFHSLIFLKFSTFPQLDSVIALLQTTKTVTVAGRPLME